MRPSAGQLRVARDFASARRDKRDSRPRVGTGDGAACASKGGDEGCVAAQGFAAARGSVDNEVEAATVVGVDLRRYVQINGIFVGSSPLVFASGPAMFWLKATDALDAPGCFWMLLDALSCSWSSSLTIAVSAHV